MSSLTTRLDKLEQQTNESLAYSRAIIEAYRAHDAVAMRAAYDKLKVIQERHPSRFAEYVLSLAEFMLDDDHSELRATHWIFSNQTEEIRASWSK